MKNVEIKVFKIGSTKTDKEEIKNWLNEIGASSFEIPTQEVISDEELIPSLAAKRCYKSFEVGLNPNVTKVRKDWVEYIDNVLKSGHGSVFEHATFTFAIENVSRVFTAELNRHRAGVAISEGSMRYIRFDDIPWWVPISLRPRKSDDNDIATKKSLTLKAFTDVFTYIEDKYKYLVNEVWDMDNIKDFHVKKIITSCLRRIIPMGVATGGIWTFNLRALRHVLALRTDPAAEEEITYVFSLIGKIMIESCSKIFGDFILTNDGCWVPKYKKV
jgi:thymidylate synthase (FAD)